MSQATETSGVEDVELRHADVVALLLPRYDAQRTEARARADKDRMTKVIGAYLDGHPGEELYDGENKLRGFLRGRQGAKLLDFGNLPIELLNWLANHDCLIFDAKAFERLQEKQVGHEVALVEPFLMPGSESASPRVEKMGE